MKDGHGHSPADVGIQGGQPVLVDLEYGEFDEKAYGIGKRLDGVLTQVEVGEVAEAVNLGGDVLQVVLGYVQTVQRRQVSDFLRGKKSSYWSWVHMVYVSLRVLTGGKCRS